MKKTIKKKMSKITKIFLVLSLIFSNLSCLSTVFAYEIENSNITLEVDKENEKIKITYQEETDANLKLRIQEKYSYLSGEPEIVNNESEVTLEELNTGYSHDLQLLGNIVFDGTYEIEVLLGYYEDNEFNEEPKILYGYFGSFFAPKKWKGRM